MKSKIVLLANEMDRRGLYEEADLCVSILSKIGKGGNAQTGHGNISTPMGPLAWFQGPCAHDYEGYSQCPACGKMLEEEE